MTDAAARVPIEADAPPAGADRDDAILTVSGLELRFGGVRALAGYLLALDLAFLSPDQFDPSVTFTGYAVLILGGLASYVGIAAGTAILWILLEGTRFINLPLSAEQIASLRFVIVGAVLIGLMAFRPQGLFGKREEMVLGG